MKRISSLMLRCGVCLSLFGCVDEGSERAPVPPPPVPVVAAPGEPPHSGPPAGTPLTLRLAAEASARPALAVHVEQLASALSARGVSIVRTRQVLARPVGARYCATIMSEKGVGAALCEFESDEAAERGAELSSEKFDRIMPGRVMRRNGNSLLTLSPGLDAPDSQAQTMLDVFGQLEAGSLPET